MRSRITATLIALATLTVAACNEVVLAIGDVNSIIVAANPLLWSEIEGPLVPTLERTVFTVRNEKTFKVTHQDPESPEWARLRLFKQELLIGSESDPWMQEALAKAADFIKRYQLDRSPGLFGRVRSFFS